MKINITAGTLKDFIESLKHLKTKIICTDSVLKINDRSLPSEIKNNDQFISAITDVFGKKIDKIDQIYEVVRRHIDVFGKSPDLRYREKVYNFIVSVSNCITLSDDELEIIRMKLISPNLFSK